MHTGWKSERCNGVPGILALLLMFAGTGGSAQTRPAPPILPPLPLKQAAAATELPLGAWGPYSRRHIGICYLANRLPVQLFSFPLVIGQRRSEIMFDPKGRSVGPRNVTLQRRALGLAPVQALNDDANPEVARRLDNRTARILEADADGILWKTQVVFAPAALTQRVVPALDDRGIAKKSEMWTEGLATVEAFPAFTDLEADGLLLRVTLENRSQAAQTYYADLLGGLDTVTTEFTAADLAVEAEGSSVTLRHAKSAAVFALAASAPYPVRASRVQDAYFSPDGAVTSRDASGAVLPFGLLKADAPPPTGGGLWGLARVDDIALNPGEKVTFWLSVGVGADAEAARRSARTLLLLAEDADVPGKPRREGAYSKATAAHNAARYSCEDPALERLMAQSLANIPYAIWRRVGVPSRAETNNRPGGWYQPEAGGYIALGWEGYRPDFAAAQLNAFFQTNIATGKPSPEPQAGRPSNLVALWELFQKTHDRAMLTAFYPAARRRYLELRNQPRDPKDNLRTSDVLRSARILRVFAQRLERTQGEIADYDRDIDEAAHALPNGAFTAALASDSGSMHYGDAFLEWKDLLDAGETAKAAEISETLLTSYRKKDADTDLSGEACALIPLYAAYHRKGSVTAGFNISLWDSQYNSERDTLRVVFRPADTAGKAAFLCVMARPDADYVLTGAITKTLHTDAKGLLTLTAPADATTQQIEISPAGNAK